MQCIRYEYDVDGENFASAGHASESVKRTLKQMGVPAASVRRVAIAMYEGEINMVIHAHGGKAIAEIYPDHIDITLKDSGPGIADIELAMKAKCASIRRSASVPRCFCASICKKIIGGVFSEIKQKLSSLLRDFARRVK